MPLLPVDTIIEVANISQYLASKDARSRYFYKNQVIDKRLHRLLYMERKALEWAWNYDPADPDINGIANYVYALCSPYSNAALTIIGQGQTGQIVNPSTGTASTIIAYYLQFVVGEPGSPMVEGETALVIPLTGFIENSVDASLDGVDLPTNRTDRQSYTVDYSNPAQITITFNQGLQGVTNGQLYDIRGWRLQAVATPAASETYFEVATYATMIALATGPYFRSFLVLNDENKGQTNTRYEYWPDSGIKEWIAAVEEP